jgi:hypothetical protein
LKEQLHRVHKIEDEKPNIGWVPNQSEDGFGLRSQVNEAIENKDNKLKTILFEAP